MFVLMLLAAKPGLVGVPRLSEQRHVKGRAGGDDARDTNVVPKDLIASKIYYVIVKTTSSS